MFKKSKQWKINEKFNRKKNYSREDNLASEEIIIWKYSQSKNNDFWFVDVEWKEKWYFVYPKNLNWAFDWDEVQSYIKTFNWRKEAVVTKVIKRADRILVWTIQIHKSYWFVILDNSLFKNDVFITYKNLQFHKNIKTWDKVAIKITRWEWKNPEWKIIEVLWNKDKPWIEVESLIIESWLRLSFPEKVIEESNNLKYEEKKGRVDLTNTFTFTIDWEDARDLDDAISIERITPPVINDIPLNWGGKAELNSARGSYKLIVSIADVSNYVSEWSILDKEALKRWNSTYLPDRVIPMLPEKLSNDLCSLNPNTKKLTLSCEIILDKSWNIVSKKVYESIISSNFRLTYSEVQNILDLLCHSELVSESFKNKDPEINSGWKTKKINIWDKLKFWWIITQELIDKVKLSYELKQIIEKKKKNKWVLDFDFPELKIILDEKNEPIQIKKYERLESHKIIEQFMILANECVWELFSKIPFLYRIHPIPNEDDIENLRKTLALFDIKLPYSKITPLLISHLLEEIKLSTKEKLLSKVVLRSLEKAIYSDINEWHFWLWLEFYSHFTSPIRRYPDLIIHRIIKEKLTKKLDEKRIEYYKNILHSIWKKTSDTERASEKLEYNVKDFFICKYYKDKIWQEESWNISWIIPAWVFIELKNWVEGFLSLDNILLSKNIRRITYEEDFLRFNLWNNEFLQIWDEINIKISWIDEERRRILFDLI